jgi:hypothetical protein
MGTPAPINSSSTLTIWEMACKLGKPHFGVLAEWLPHRMKDTAATRRTKQPFGDLPVTSTEIANIRLVVHSGRHRRILRTVLDNPATDSVRLRITLTAVFGALLPFCLIASGAPTQQRLAASSSFRNASVRGSPRWISKTSGLTGFRSAVSPLTSVFSQSLRTIMVLFGWARTTACIDTTDTA